MQQAQFRIGVKAEHSSFASRWGAPAKATTAPIEAPAATPYRRAAEQKARKADYMRSYMLVYRAKLRAKEQTAWVRVPTLKAAT